MCGADRTLISFPIRHGWLSEADALLFGSSDAGDGRRSVLRRLPQGGVFEPFSIVGGVQVPSNIALSAHSRGGRARMCRWVPAALTRRLAQPLRIDARLA